MKTFIKLAAISIAAVFIIYLLAGKTQAPSSSDQVKTTAVPKTSASAKATTATAQESSTKATAKVAPKKLILAEIDEQKISGDDFNKYLALFKDNDPQQPVIPAFREMQLKNLIHRTLLLKEARKQGYFNDEELKKHSSLNPTEHETIVLRRFLTDKVSRPAAVNDADLKTYLKTHPNFSPEAAREKLTTERQQQLFLKLIHALKSGHKIIIHHENLQRL